MEYKNDWDKSKERLKALWHRQVLDRCCISVSAPKKGCTYTPDPLPENPQDRLHYWTDGEWILRRKRAYFENTYFGGEAFPQIFVNLGAAGHAGFFKNANYRMEDSVWFFPSITAWEENAVVLDTESMLYRKTFELTRFFVEEAQGAYFVSMPDISGNADALAHLRGSESLLVDMIVDKEAVHKALATIQDVWHHTNEKLYQMVHQNNEGGCTIGWMDTWAPGKHTQMQCDMSVMISPALFHEFILPELIAQTKWMDYSTYHFDGVDQIKHLDMLLSLESLHMIQWTSVAGQLSPLRYLDVLKRIQAAGKCLLLFPKISEIEPLMEELSSKGLYLVTSAASQDEAEAIIEKVKTLTHE